MTTITTSTIRPTTTGVRGALDVTVTVDGIEGEATVHVDEINGGYCVYGDCVDMWLSGNLCRLGRDVIAEINREVCAAAAEHDGDADGPAAVGTAARDAADAALVSILTPEQLERHAIGALPPREMRWALADALVKGVAERLGDGFHVDVLDEVVPTWGELPPGGFHIVRRLGLVPGVLLKDWHPVGGRLIKWGNASELATGPVVAIAATADDGTEYVLGVSRT